MENLIAVEHEIHTREEIIRNYAEREHLSDYEKRVRERCISELPRLRLDKIDILLGGLGTVSRFYTDEDNLVIKTTPENKRGCIGTTEMLGWELYDTGCNGSDIMLTFKRK